MGYSSTPAQMVHELIVSKIQGFQASVVRRQAASTLDHRCCLGLAPCCAHLCLRPSEMQLQLLASVQSGRPASLKL